MARIVFLNVTGSLGGAERVLLILLRELRRLRPAWQLTLVVGGTGLLTAAAESLGCTVEVLPLPPSLAALGDWGNASKLTLLRDLFTSLPALFRYRHVLQRLLRNLAPGIVQTNGFKMHVLGALACPRGARLFWHIHDFVSSRSAMRILLRWCSAKPVAVIAISSAVAEDLAPVLKQPEKLHTIWNSVELERFAPAPCPPHSGIRIGLVATFARWKGHKVFLRALAMLPQDLLWQAVIVGAEIYGRTGSQWTRAELEQYAEDLRLSGSIEFTGFLADPAAVLKSLDIAVHASDEPEPFGLVIAEAMAAGLAVVTTSPNLVTDGVDGLVCRPGDAPALAQAMGRLARDPKLRQSLSEAARQTALARFQPERMAQEFIALHEGVSA